MSCQNQYFYEGYRSYGDYVPASCQGKYFPGDEPEWRCRITGDTCMNIDGDNPTECNAFAETDELCPYCMEEYQDRTLLFADGHGNLYCKECGGRI